MRIFFLVAVGLFGSGINLFSADVEIPTVLDARYKLELIAREPQIVTPVGITCDSVGRLLVIESHTHQRPDDYDGPPTDRILMLDSPASASEPSDWKEFFSGESQTMSLMVHEGWCYVATRREVFRIRDTNGDDRADARQSLVKLETNGDYPHNGLGGITFDADGTLYFGLGENLGEPYRLVGSDGSSCSGEAEGGSVYRCRSDGSQLQRVATGFWNPFGNVFDQHGRLFTVDNDPDASPPCRLLHVAPCADYGYQFRYGRSGRHPLQAWDGELPGTLPMAAGTGEAPCQVVEYRGRLWVTSWGDHCVEAFTLVPQGATVQGRREIIVQGNQDFRPVGMVVTPDQSVCFTDWVDRSYPVHGKGRIWRLTYTGPPNQANDAEGPPPSELEERSRALQRAPDLAALSNADAFVRQAVVAGLVESRQVSAGDWQRFADEPQRLGLLQVLRWQANSQLPELIRLAIDDRHETVRQYALRLIAENRLDEFRDDLRRRLSDREMSDLEWELTLATFTWLQDGMAGNDARPMDETLAKLLEQATDDIQAYRALRHLSTEHPLLTADRLTKLARHTGPVAREAIHVLAAQANDEAVASLTSIAADDSFPLEVRLDAIAGLAGATAYLATSQQLARLSESHEPSIQVEAKRSLRSELIPPTAPPAVEIDAWLELIGESPGDVAAGRRVFFRSVGGRCAVCHRHGSRGGDVGPDLTMIHRRATPRFLLESILTPSREVGPRFCTVSIITDDGRAISGLPITGPGETGQETYMTSTGDPVTVDTQSIESRTVLGTSIMPEGLDRMLAVDEFRDLIAFLLDGAHTTPSVELER